MKPPPRRGWAGVLLLVGASLLSHLGAAIPGRAYYFRDFGMAFYPFRVFWARELASGHWPFWNPYIQDGVFAFPMYYPVDLLHALWPNPTAVSWLLTMHFPVAALGAGALARELGASRGGSFVTGAGYALGGLAVASLNLYVFLQALALVPFVALLFYRAAVRGGRCIPLAALTLGVALTTAQEFVAQGLLLGLALGLVWDDRRAEWLRTAARLALALIVGGALAAVPIALVAGILPETLRGQGFALSSAMEYQLHPAVLLQTVLRDAFGSPTQPVELWWGHRFFTRGFPYFVSLYLGPQLIALAVTGCGALIRRRLALLGALAGLGLWYALGTWGGLAPALASLPIVRSFRYPSKAFLLPYAVLVLLAGRGFDRLRNGRGWRAYRATALAAAALTLAIAGVAWLAPEAIGEWMQSDPVRDPLLGAALARDGGLTGVVALLGVLLALAVGAGAITPSRAAVVVVVVLVLDLARAGAGVNPLTTPSFYGRLPEAAAEGLDDLEGGRVFSYGIEHSPIVDRYVRQHAPGTLLAAYFVKRQVLTPYTNLIDRVESGPIEDTGAFVFLPQDIPSWEYHPTLVGRILPRLRNGAVTRVLSVDPLDHADLRLRAAIPAGPPGLNVHVYELAHPWPRRFVACRILPSRDRAEALARPFQEGYDAGRDIALEETGRASCHLGSVHLVSFHAGAQTLDVESDGPGYLVTRDSYARGWTARVDGTLVRLLRANGRHQAVPIPGGRHRVDVVYDPPGLRLGLAVMALGLLAAVSLAVRPMLVGSHDPALM